MSNPIPEPTEDDVVIRACSPVSLMPVPPLLRSVKGECEECKTEVWIDPEQEVPEPHVVLCIPHALGRVQSEGGIFMNFPGIDPFEVPPTGGVE